MNRSKHISDFFIDININDMHDLRKYHLRKYCIFIIGDDFQRLMNVRLIHVIMVELVMTTSTDLNVAVWMDI